MATKYSYIYEKFANGNIVRRKILTKNLSKYSFSEEYIYNGKQHTNKNRRFHHKTKVYSRMIKSKLVVISGIFGKNLNIYVWFPNDMNEMYLKDYSDKKIKNTIYETIKKFMEDNNLNWLPEFMFGDDIKHPKVDISIGPVIQRNSGLTLKEMSERLKDMLKDATYISPSSHHGKTKAKKKFESEYKNEYENNGGI